MSEKKVLSINPDLFSVSNFNNKTKKGGQKKKPSEKIKIKSGLTSREKQKDKTLKKRSLLRLIRQQQQKNYDNMFNNNLDKNVIAKENFGNEFEKATQFLDNLVKSKPVTQSVTPKNTTLKNKTLVPEVSNMVLPGVMPVNNDIVNLNFPTIPDNNPLQLKTPFVSALQETPKYGCLKNGSLPTYRNLMNKTFKRGGAITESVENIAEKENIVKEKIREKSTILQQKDMNKKMFRTKPKRNKKQRRTIKRTFNIGKSKLKPTVSVLVSNKTIRNKVVTQKQLLKQESIPDIKKYLVKHGFIKVGATTPNDILRKMYESALLICGEVTNHNPDNLLYNFLNTKE